MSRLIKHTLRFINPASTKMLIYRISPMESKCTDKFSD